MTKIRRVLSLIIISLDCFGRAANSKEYADNLNMAADIILCTTAVLEFGVRAHLFAPCWGSYCIGNSNKIVHKNIKSIDKKQERMIVFESADKTIAALYRDLSISRYLLRKNRDRHIDLNEFVIVFGTDSGNDKEHRDEDNTEIIEDLSKTLNQASQLFANLTGNYDSISALIKQTRDQLNAEQQLRILRVLRTRVKVGDLLDAADAIVSF
ncbi:uncharacterized protein V2V93DRAFT_372538 [Kockiozyma suomiensis]|uniref:uncharacterized protein n=1 Tax=Kockiozyma suomiensis TaxID=1337062 RepID=UPI003343D12C